MKSDRMLTSCSTRNRACLCSNRSKLCKVSVVELLCTNVRMNVVLNAQYLYASVEIKKMIFLYLKKKMAFSFIEINFLFLYSFLFLKFYITGRNEWG